MAEPISTKVGLDPSDFKAGITEINKSMRVMESEFKASAAALGDWSKDATGLEKRIGFLTNAIELQQKKIGNLKALYEDQVKKTGENSAAAKDYAIKINNATGELNKMQREMVEDKKSLDQMKKGSDNAAKGLQTLKSIAGGLVAVLKVAGAAILGMIGAVTGLAFAMTRLVFSTAEESAALADLSAKTGLSTDRLQELAYVGDQVGTSQETIVSSLTRLTRSMSEAAKKADGDLGKAFKSLGVRVMDINGNLRDNESVFADTIDALGRISNETERDALAMQIFGKSAQELNPLIKAGSAEFNNLIREAHAVGAVVSGEDVQAFADFQDTLDSLKAGLKGTLATLGAVFLPGFQSVFTQAGFYLEKFAAIVKGADGDIGKIAEGVTGLIERIVADIAAQAPRLLTSGLVILQTIVKSILTSLPVILPAVINLLLSFLKFIIQNAPLLITAGLQMLILLIQGLTEAIPDLIPVIILAIEMIMTTLIENAPLLIEAAAQLIGALAGGLIVYLPEIVLAAFRILKAIFDTLYKNGPTLLYNIAAGLINGFINGWDANWAKMVAAVGQSFNDLVSYIKGLLGIASPSKVSMGWGKNLALGMGLGFGDAFGGVQRGMESAVRSLSLSPSLSLSGAGATGAAGGGGSRSLTLNLNIGGASLPQMRKEIADSEEAVLTEISRALRSIR